MLIVATVPHRYENCYNIVILVSGDGDFANLVRELQDKGKKVIIFAQPQVSQKLIILANEFYLVSQIPLCGQAA
ncbi:NYN domain-containing protein [Microcoleus sp. FACHB-SPT15]|uniref:NYN domain-containing protein n=1 Tax=Microcoleus sp. FACHB-SPT15 TaxID=2692830 RepID=UPI0018EFDDD2